MNLIFNAYKTLEDYNMSAGPQTILVAAAGASYVLIPLILFFFFVIICLGTYFTEKRFTGRSNFPASFAVAGWFIAILSFVMNLIPGLINLFTMAVCIVVAVLGTLWLYFHEKR